MSKPLIHILLILISSMKLAAQVDDDSSLHQTAEKIIQIYYQSLGEQSPLYNGSEYLEYAFTIQEGHPFFGSPGYINGSIYFDGMVFEQIPMVYDIVKDQVVILDFHKVHKISVPADRIQQFELSGHTFLRIVQDSMNQIRTGFYERLYDGKTALFAKREKKIIQQYSSMEINNVVFSQNAYYIRKEKIFYLVKNKSSLLNILRDRKKDIVQYLKKNKIKFKKDPERAIIMAVEYYDHSTK